MLRFSASTLSAASRQQTCCNIAARLMSCSGTRAWGWPASLPQQRTSCRAQSAQPHASIATAPVQTQRTMAFSTSAHAAAEVGRAGASQRADQQSAGRLRVAVDIDEVLGRFLYSLNQYCQEVHGMKYNLDDYFVYEFYKIWGCTPERSNEIVHEYFKSPHFSRGIPIIPGAADALARLSHSCDLMVVTSRQHAIQQSTLQWIEEHYPGVFQDVHFGNHWALEGASRKKSEICRSIGAHLLIDDNPGYATECAEAGMHVLLYDWEHAYPWSKIPSGSMHPRITVVRDWTEVEKAVRVMAPKLLLGEEPDRLR